MGNGALGRGIGVADLSKMEILGEKANEKKVEFYGTVEAGVPFAINFPA